MTNFLDFIGTDLSDRFPILARDTSTFDDAYLECYKDYSSLAEYRTYAILERVGRSLLTDLIADVESQQEFCDSACKFVCSVAEAAPPVGCEPGCGAVCNGVDYNGTANATAVVEAILDYFIPEVEQYAWAVDSEYIQSFFLLHACEGCNIYFTILPRSEKKIVQHIF